MAKKLHSDVSVGLLVVDWDKRKTDFIGLDGLNDMSLEELEEEFEERKKELPAAEVTVLVYWKDNDQLAIHDSPYSGDFLEDDEEVDEELTEGELEAPEAE